jgi:hypothetical protein
LQHAAELAADMRSADALESLAALGLPPLETLHTSLSVSTLALSLVAKEGVLAMCGVAPFPRADGTEVGNLWLLTSTLVDKHPKAFFRAARLVVPLMLEAYPNGLFNFVDARYAKAVRLLRALGFHLAPAVPYGLGGELFFPFTLEALPCPPSQQPSAQSATSTKAGIPKCRALVPSSS